MGLCWGPHVRVVLIQAKLGHDIARQPGLLDHTARLVTLEPRAQRGGGRPNSGLARCPMQRRHPKPGRPSSHLNASRATCQCTPRYTQNPRSLCKQLVDEHRVCVKRCEQICKIAPKSFHHFSSLFINFSSICKVDEK